MPKGGERWFSVVAQHGIDKLSAVRDPENLKQLDPMFLERKFALVAADLEEHHAEQPLHWYVHVLGVTPDGRGRGLSRNLLSVVFSWASKAGANVYLECGGVNVPIYEALGFRAVWEEE